MRIPAVRYQVLSKETNLATADFQVQTDNQPLNFQVPQLGDLETELEGFISKETSNIADQAKSALDSSLRQARDLYSSAKDLSRISTNDIDQMFGEMLPDNPSLQAAYKKISANCRSKALKNPRIGKPFGPTVDCGTGKKNSGGNCNSSKVSDLYDKLTGGALKANYEDLNNLLKRLVGLSALGYDFNMCGVFGAIGAGMPTNVLSRGAGGVLGILASGKNTAGIFDLAKSQIGLGTKLQLPKAASKVFQGFKIPEGAKKKNYGELGESALGSAELYDEIWRAGSNNADISVYDMVENGENEDLDDVMSCLADKEIPDSSDLDMIPDNDDYTSAVAYQGHSFGFP